MTLPAVRQPHESRWTFLTGPLKGTIHPVTLANIVIGRSPECDIVVVNDAKCSRKHARVDWTEEGFVIQSLSSSNLLKINGDSINKSLLREGDIVSLGDTDLQFNINGAPTTPSIRSSTQPSVANRPSPQLELVQPPPPLYDPVTAGDTQVTRVGMAAPPRPQKKKKFSTGSILLWGTVLIILGYLVNYEVATHKPMAIKTSEQTENDIKEAEKLRQVAEADRKKRLGNSNEVRQAQENYVKGFRDYKKGQYERAVESFQACLSLYPEHVLCNRYLRLSQKKFDELIEAEMVLGRKYRDQGLYRECMSAFQNVRTMVKDFSSTRYKEGKANYDACAAFVEGRY